ncbi:MAG: hypothetical protein ACOCXJ_02940, partial [Planctomycetota bacterium]
MTIIDAATGEPAEVYKPGVRLMGRLQMPPGQTLRDLGERDSFELTLAVSNADGRSYRRSISFHKRSDEPRDEVPMDGDLLEVPVL